MAERRKQLILFLSDNFKKIKFLRNLWILIANNLEGPYKRTQTAALWQAKFFLPR